jgi:hypothetical protein
VDRVMDVERDLKKNHQSQVEVAKQFVEIRGKQEKLSPSTTSDEVKRIEAEIVECRQLMELLAQQNQYLLTRRNEALASPVYLYWKAIRFDERRPTEGNISGVWTSGSNSFCVVQLEQNGELIEGRGYRASHHGIFSHFQVTGTYHSGKLSLIFSDQRGVGVQEFVYSPIRKKPNFRPLNDPSDTTNGLHSPGLSLAEVVR